MKIRRFQLERYLAGELEGEERAALERALEVDADAKATLAALQREQEQFEAEVPYARFRIDHERRMEKPARFRWLLWLGSGLALAGGGVGVLLMAALGAAEFSHLDPDGIHGETRLKGDGVAVSLYVRGEDGVAAPGTSGQTVSGGTVVQLTYEAEGYRFGAVLGVDGTGAVTPYWPRSADVMEPLPSERGRFPFALELDDTPGREVFHAVFANERRFLSELRGVLLDAGGEEPRWPKGTGYASTWVVKRVSNE